MASFRPIQRLITLLRAAFLLVACSMSPASVFSQSVAPESAQNLRVDIYSARVAELFWDRSLDPFTQYDVFRDGELVSQAQFGISYFDSSLIAEQLYSYSIVAIDGNGNRSDAVSIDVNTATGGGQGPSPSVPQPQGLRASAYSAKDAELFWERADEPFTQYDIFRDNLRVSEVA